VPIAEITYTSMLWLKSMQILMFWLPYQAKNVKKKAFSGKEKNMKIGKYIFILNWLVLILLYGNISSRYNLFPNSFISKVRSDALEFFNSNVKGETWLHFDTNYSTFSKADSNHVDGSELTLISGISKDLTIFAKIINQEGESLHTWDIDWFELWPNPLHVTKSKLPKSIPGTHIHGIVFLENGDIIFNFEYLGLIRLDWNGNVIWRLPYITHHSVDLDDYNNIWVSGRRPYKNSLTAMQNIGSGSAEEIVLKVSPRGEILKEISVFELLVQNNLQGLLFMSGKGDRTKVSGDLLHLNDVEPFSDQFQEGVFKHGDVMISLRNINTVLIFNENTNIISFTSVGEFVRQHDPDFIDGNCISVFDNNRITEHKYGNGASSKIVIKSFRDNSLTTFYEGNEAHPFYSRAQGKHQWLGNGNVLVTESLAGRVFEVNANGNITWQYVNVVEDGRAGLIEQGVRLPGYINQESLTVFGKANHRGAK
jgi:hypothetical protein